MTFIQPVHKIVGIPPYLRVLAIMSTTRVRGLNAILTDVTNTASPPPTKRLCAESAGRAINDHYKIQASRGRHVAQEFESTSTSTSDTDEYDYSTMKQIATKRPEILQGLRALREYSERNTYFAIQKAHALQIFSGAVLSGKKVLEACDLAAASTTFSSRTIRRWASDVFAGYSAVVSSVDDITDERLELELMSGRGSHSKWVTLIADENFRKEAKEYVLENGYVKGKPNLTLQKFVSWVKEHKGVDICVATASLWLHDVGFSYKQFSKGVYFDGHERDDVVRQRKLYLEKLASYSHRMWTSHSPAPNPSSTPVIRIFHDESTFYANADQTFHWTDGSRQALKQKSLGQAVMVSDFLGGFLEHAGERHAFSWNINQRDILQMKCLLLRLAKRFPILRVNIHLHLGFSFLITPLLTRSVLKMHSTQNG